MVRGPPSPGVAVGLTHPTYDGGIRMRIPRNLNDFFLLAIVVAVGLYAVWKIVSG